MVDSLIIDVNAAKLDSIKMSIRTQIDSGPFQGSCASSLQTLVNANVLVGGHSIDRSDCTMKISKFRDWGRGGGGGCNDHRACYSRMTWSCKR